MKREKLIDFETAKLAKEVGFSNGSENSFFEAPDDYIYDEDPNHPESYKKGEIREYSLFVINERSKLDKDHLCERPTQTLLQKWLREDHGIHIDVETYCDEVTTYRGVVFRTNREYITKALVTVNSENQSYEETLEGALKEGLNLIKEELYERS